jgi:nucleotide-binding universal stress UspA family protein
MMSAETIRRILVPTDFSPAAETALEQAVVLGRACNAEVTLLHVVKDVYTTMQLMAYAPAWGPLSEELAESARAIQEQARESLRAAVAPFESAGAQLHTQIRVGAAFVEIIHAVQLGDYDLVVTGTRGQSTVKRSLVGSTATRLARKCPCPLWVARPRATSAVRSVLVPVDFSEVSRKAMIHAAALAESTGAALHLLHVYDTDDLRGAPLLPAVTKAEFARYRRQVRRAALNHLEDFRKTLNGMPAKTTVNVRPGIPWQVIRATARRVEADVIVMGSVGRSGVSGLLIGNTAEKVLHSADASVLIVKPDGFVSPVLRPEKIEVKPHHHMHEPVAL